VSGWLRQPSCARARSDVSALGETVTSAWREMLPKGIPPITCARAAPQTHLQPLVPATPVLLQAPKFKGFEGHLGSCPALPGSEDAAQLLCCRLLPKSSTQIPLENEGRSSSVRGGTRGRGDGWGCWQKIPGEAQGGLRTFPWWCLGMGQGLLARKAGLQTPGSIARLLEGPGSWGTRGVLGNCPQAKPLRQHMDAFTVI